MQWLIDLVIEAIGVPPCFIRRTGVLGWDFLTGDFTTDGNWHDLDLSAFVPADSTGVLLRVQINDNLISQRIRIRNKTDPSAANASECLTQVANTFICYDIICPLDSTRIIEYNASNVVWGTIQVIARGWWK